MVTRGVSAYPQAVTKQMVANFERGGAAINQLDKLAGADLRVVPIDLDRPTGDITAAPAMNADEFLAAVDIGYRTVPSCVCSARCHRSISDAHFPDNEKISSGLDALRSLRKLAELNIGSEVDQRCSSPATCRSALSG
jgi:hypothetical protein